MSAAPAIAASTGAAVIGGATPFGWAQLGASLIGGVSQGAPAGPAISGAGGGGQSLGFDNSGWTVSTGGGSAVATAGDRGGVGGYGGALAGSSIPMGALLLVGAVALVLLWKR